MYDGRIWEFPSPPLSFLSLSLSLSPFFIQLGGEVGVVSPQMEKMKTFMRGMAILLIPVSAKFPSVSIYLF